MLYTHRRFALAAEWVGGGRVGEGALAGVALRLDVGGEVEAGGGAVGRRGVDEDSGEDGVGCRGG